MANIRFSEWRLGSEAGPKITATAKKAGYSDSDINRAILACDVYIPLNGYYNKGENTSETKGMETASDDLFDNGIDFAGNDSATKSLSKDYSKGETHKYATGLTLTAYNKRTTVWDMEKALTTGEKVRVETTDPLYERTALNNEIILIKTLTYLSGQTAAPKVLARPAFENNGELVVSDEPMPLKLISLYFNVYFSYVTEVAMYDVVSPFNTPAGYAKKDKIKQDLQKKFADKAAEKGYNIDPDKDWDKATLADGIRKRVYGISKVLGIEPEHLNLAEFFSLSVDFLINGFWETVESSFGLHKEMKDDTNFNTNKGVLLDSKFQSMISSVDNLLASGFSMTTKGRDNEDTSLMSWIANGLRLRFNYFKKVIFQTAARKYKLVMAASADEMASDVDDKSGSNRLERELYKAGAYSRSFDDSEEFEIDEYLQKIDKFIAGSKNLLIDNKPLRSSKGVDSHINCAPILRYLAAMIEYPRTQPAKIIKIMGTAVKAKDAGPSTFNMLGTPLRDDGITVGSLTRISQIVSPLLKKAGILDTFMTLINTVEDNKVRRYFLYKLGEVYDNALKEGKISEEGLLESGLTKTLKKTSYDTDESFNSQDTRVTIEFQPHETKTTDGINWFYADYAYLSALLTKKGIDKETFATKQGKIRQDEDGPLYYWDEFMRFNQGAIIAPQKSQIPFERPESFNNNDKKDADAIRKAKDRDNAEQDKGMSDIFFNGTKVPASFRASNIEDDDEMDAVNESLFNSIHKSYMKNKLFETIYNKAQKRD